MRFLTTSHHDIVFDQDGDAICDQRFWVPNGILNCGKGDPMQISQMTHGAAPARFRQINVGQS